MRRDKNFVWRRVDARSLDLKGMKVAIVGGTGGIGRASSRFLVSRGAAVLVVGQTFRDADLPGIEFIKADLGLMREARRVGSLLPAETLDLVIFTTGIIAAPKREETAEGIERDIAISYLSRLVIMREIAPRLNHPSIVGILALDKCCRRCFRNNLRLERHMHFKSAGNDFNEAADAEDYKKGKLGSGLQGQRSAKRKKRGGDEGTDRRRSKGESHCIRPKGFDLGGRRSR
jgi:hypothetical protein